MVQRIIRTSQPQTAVGVNASLGLVTKGVWNLNSRLPKDTTGKYSFLYSGGTPAIVLKASTGGLGLTNSGTNSGAAVFGSLGIGARDYWFSLNFTWANYVSSGSGYNVLGQYGAGVLATVGVSFRTDSTNKLFATMDNGVTEIATPSALVVGKVYTALVYSIGTTAYFYLNGVLVGTSTKGTPVETSGAGVYVSADYPVNNSLRTYYGTIHGVAIGVGALSPSLGSMLSGNFWQIFDPITRTIFSAPAPAGGDITGTLSATETGSDTIASSGLVKVQGPLSVSETGADTIASSGKVIVQGALSVAETGADTSTSSGKVIVTGSMDVAEVGADTAVISGKVIVQGALAVSETGSDTAAFNGTSTVTITGTMSASESGDDTAVMSGLVKILGLFSASETGSDSAVSAGTVLVKGLLTAIESGQDTAVIAGAIYVNGLMAALETGADTFYAYQTIVHSAYTSTVPIYANTSIVPEYLNTSTVPEYLNTSTVPVDPVTSGVTV